MIYPLFLLSNIGPKVKMMQNKIIWVGIILLCSAWMNNGMIILAQEPDSKQDTVVKWNHPVFTERMGERNKMVNEISSHYYIPVKDPKVISALRNVPRHKFVPDELQSKAYSNSPLPIGYGQTISQPLIVAHMTELLEIDPGDKILEIGTGSGYQAAILAELTPYVYSIEIVPELASRAAIVLKLLGYSTVITKNGDGYNGWEEYAPFDGIIVTCAPENIPQPLIDQLNPGGVIVIPVGERNETQMLIVVRKSKNGKIFQEKQFPVRFVPMISNGEENF